MAAFFDSLTGVRSLGEILAVASGLVWAVAVILYRVSGRNVHPLGLNLFKNILALVFMAPTMLILGQALFPAASAGATGLLLLSGFLGIAVSDTFFFYSLNRLGASIVAIVDCFYSPFVIGLSFVILGERMAAWQLIGVALIITAVLAASRSTNGVPVTRRDLIIGLIYGVLAMFFVAIGIVIVKPVLATTSIVWATLVRIVGGTVPLVLLIPLLPERRAILKPLLDRANWKAMVPASFFGSYGSLILWMGGMKYAKASVAAALNQLNTIFIVVLAALFLKERLGWWKIAAVVLAFVGAYLAAVSF
ncbi:MAG TPA: DMT family transporter [Burkholderiales bacterium]|nr:DMT family transporter [Burkholderiales bacterium]